MKQIIPFFLASIVLGQAQPNQGGQVQPGYRIQLKASPAAQPEAPTVEKESGDSVVVDADGTIVCSSRGRTYSFRATNQMSPRIDVAYSFVNGRVAYQYRVTNGVDALKRIGAVKIAITPPSDLVVPEPWTMVQIAKPTEPPAFGLHRLVPDGDRRGVLSAGGALGPITFTSDSLPGLVDATFYPEPEVIPAAGDFFFGSSPWVQQQLARLALPSQM